MCLRKRERTYLFLPFGTTLVRQPHYAGGRCADKLEEYTAVLGIEPAWIPWLGHIAVCYHLIWNNTHVKCWWYLFVDTDIQWKVEQTGKVKRNFPSAWLQHPDACASFKWWAYLLQGEGCQPYYSDRFVWQWTPNRGKKELHSEEGKIKCK